MQVAKSMVLAAGGAGGAAWDNLRLQHPKLLSDADRTWSPCNLDWDETCSARALPLPNKARVREALSASSCPQLVGAQNLLRRLAAEIELASNATVGSPAESGPCEAPPEGVVREPRRTPTELLATVGWGWATCISECVVLDYMTVPPPIVCLLCLMRVIEHCACLLGRCPGYYLDIIPAHLNNARWARGRDCTSIDCGLYA